MLCKLKFYNIKEISKMKLQWSPLIVFTDYKNQPLIGIRNAGNETFYLVFESPLIVIKILLDEYDHYKR